jgi:hypothetical protein
MQRRENLRRSAAGLKLQLDDAKAAVAEELEKMKKAELLDDRQQMRERSEEEAPGEPAGLLGQRRSPRPMPRRRDKKRAVTSLDVVTTRSPSGLNAALFTAPPCPLRTPICLPLYRRSWTGKQVRSTLLG